MSRSWIRGGGGMGKKWTYVRYAQKNKQQIQRVCQSIEERANGGAYMGLNISCCGKGGNWGRSVDKTINRGDKK